MAGMGLLLNNSPVYDNVVSFGIEVFPLPENCLSESLLSITTIAVINFDNVYAIVN